MRELILLRHAHAMEAVGDLADKDRPLSTHGLLEAQAAGRWLHQQRHIPAQVLCSPARRCCQTLDVVLAAGDASPTADVHLNIYEATCGTLISLLDTYWREPSLLLVGHNPGLERLLALLSSGQSGQWRGMAPATLAVLALPETSNIEPGCAQLRAFWSPPVTKVFSL